MSRFHNLLGAIPLIAWFGWGLSREIPAFMRAYYTPSTPHLSALFALQALAQAASIAFTSLIIILLVVRTTPKTQMGGLPPYLAALVGTFAASSLFLLPVTRLSVSILVLATLLIVIGLGLSIYTLIYLGPSFALLPSARLLVTDGPYRFVRHPLYLFEEIAVLGIMIQFIQPLAVLIVAVHLTAQLKRMQYEEKILSDAFPGYTAYATRIARLIPGIY